jgi:hypothetical protein
LTTTSIVIGGASTKENVIFPRKVPNRTEMLDSRVNGISPSTRPTRVKTSPLRHTISRRLVRPTVMLADAGKPEREAAPRHAAMTIDWMMAPPNPATNAPAAIPRVAARSRSPGATTDRAFGSSFRRTSTFPSSIGRVPFQEKGRRPRRSP